MLITLELIERQRLSQPLLYLSAFIEAYRRDYYELLQRIRTHGDWAQWILRYELAGKPRAQQLIDKLFENPYLTVGRAQRLLGVSNPTARALINDLARRHVLEEVSGRRWAKLYVAKAILRIVEVAHQHD
ncbi:MAG: hypothetical protein M3Q32_02105 [Pseudomonadota bacterium]|nr:hypothetical protein [Pseudomonadota bacterium]